MTTLQEAATVRWIVVDSCKGKLHHYDNIEYDQVNTCRCGAYVLTRNDDGYLLRLVDALTDEFVKDLVHVGPCDYGLACKLGKH